MPTDTNVNTLIINKLTKAQYDSATKSNTELYIVTDANNDVITLPMFFATYQPRKFNNASWLRADPYSWHSADVYVSAYAHLADSISGVTAETESIYTRFIQPILSANGTLGGDSFAVACSSNFSGRDAYKSFDGNSASKWGLGNTSSGWLTFYNPKALKVKYITYTPSTDYPGEDGGNLTIYGSNDNSTWTSLWTGTYTANTQSTFNVNSQAFYKYYKIEITNPTSNYAGLGNLHISADEFIASITYYRAADANKIVLPDQASNLEAIYNATGIGYYFILDTTNQRFKLPRNTYGFTGLRTNAGDYVSESLPNITGTLPDPFGGGGGSAQWSGAFAFGNYNGSITTSTVDYDGYDISFDASRSSSAYQNNAPVQQRATQAYLYFYVGNTVQDATLIDVGEITETLNEKADLDLANINNAGKIVAAKASMPSGIYDDLTVGSTAATYTAPSDGYFCAIGYGTSNNMWIELVNTSCGDYCQGVYGTVAWQYKVSLAAKKGDVVTMYYDNINFASFRFIYAEGSKSEA